MIEIKITEDMWALAQKKSNEQPIFDNSHRKEMANQVGCLGEVIGAHWMKSKNITFIDQTHLTTHDFLLTSSKKTVDVKTKDRTVRPQPSYDCSVPDYNHSFQKPNFFLFISLLRDKNFPDETSIKRFTHSFVLGTIEYKDFEKKAKFWDAGSVDAKNGTKFWTACWNIGIDELISPSSIKNF